MTMIERVARALSTSYGLDWDKMSDGSFDAAGDRLCRGFWHCMAKDAIEAMRKPTAAMVRDGDEAVDEYLHEDTACHAWRAMIDAILKEGA